MFGLKQGNCLSVLGTVWISVKGNKSMKKIGILIELKDGVLKPANLSMITAAVKEGHELFTILMEPATSEIQQQLSVMG